MERAATRQHVDFTLVGQGILAVVAWFLLYEVNHPFWTWLLFDVFGLDAESRLGESVLFFLYDTSKILLLLGGVIFVVTVLRSFFSVERTRALLGGKREGAGNVIAALLGTVTPFCSCSAVPAFIGFVAAGVPLGVTLSFLIASPLVNEIAVALLLGLFGPWIALLYVAAGMSIAIVSGVVLGRLKLERYVEPFVFETHVGSSGLDPSKGLSWHERIEMGIVEVKSILRKVWPYLLVGIALGAIIHGWVPEDLFVRYAGSDKWWSVPVAVVLGIPLYSNAAGILPLIESLYDKGMPMGTLLAFMMAVVALSLPEMIILRRVLKPQLILSFIAIVGAGIVSVGFLFNAVL